MTEMFEQSPDTRKTSNRPDRVAGVLSSYQYLLPHHLLSGLMYRLTRLTWRPFKNLFINAFISWFDVDMSIARTSDPRRYDTFNAFFTRQLVPGARPVEQRPGSIVSPVDGSVSQYGRIHEDRLLQAKGRDFTLSALLGGDEVLASRFKDGEFITLYLSPRDYHRIHMPVSGELQSMIYLPGSLFSVSPTTARGIDRLYARNERVINIFDTEMGAMALIMVGAIFVGSMETVWAGQITPASDRRQFVNDYTGRDEAIHLNRGDEAGRFNMGSTVILLFERNKLTWDKGLAAASGVRMGELIAQQRDQQDDP